MAVLPRAWGLLRQTGGLTTQMLKMALPMIVPIPIALPGSVSTLSASDTKSSGAEEPAAMKVAPATSSDSFKCSEI